MYLSKPEHENDKEGAAQMQDEEDQISAKQQEVADAQKKVDELQAKLTALTPAPTPNPN
jgi:peptidoglycan hydrolase CwlO-like protein